MTTETVRLRQRVMELEREVLALRRSQFLMPELVTTPLCWWVRMDAYEIANLRSAIEAATGWRGGDQTEESWCGDLVNPLQALNTGDWIGQLYWRLPKVDYVPNVEPDELVNDAKVRGKRFEPAPYPHGEK